MADGLLAALLLSLRIVPVFAFAPPFTLMRVPATVRLILALAIAGWTVAATPALADRIAGGNLVLLAATELTIGIAIALALQLAFAAILFAGRAVDIQSGYGLAMLIDPANQSQMPLVGTMLANVAAVTFFALGGGADLLAAFALSVDRYPPGMPIGALDPAGVLSYFGLMIGLAMGLLGIVFVVLFLVDLAIAFLSRTMPQMNMLLLGFQVKVIVTLLTLPIALGMSGALFVQMMRLAIERLAAPFG